MRRDMNDATRRRLDTLLAEALAQLAQFGIERGSQFVAAALIDQDVEWLRGADLGV
jgi:hypothetical protein